MAGEIPSLKGLGTAKTHSGEGKKSRLAPSLLSLLTLPAVAISCSPKPTPDIPQITAPTTVLTEGVPTPIATESPTYKQLDAIRQKVVDLASQINGISILDSANSDQLLVDQKTILQQFQDSQQADIDNFLTQNTLGAKITLASTQVISAMTDQGGSFEAGFSTLQYSNISDGKPLGSALTFQFKDVQGNVVNAALLQDTDQTIDGKIVRRFMALSGQTGGVIFPAIIAVYDNSTDASPAQVYVLIPDGNGNFKVMPLKGDADAQNIQAFSGQTENISFKITRPTPTVIETPSVPMIEVGGLQIPDPKASNPEFFDLTKSNSPIVQFANAFGVNPEEVGDLTPQLLTGVDGKQLVVMTTGDLAATANFDESGTPLLIAEQGENGEWGWSSEAITRKLADLTGRKVVSYCFWQKLNDREYVDFFLNNFNEMRIGEELKNNNIFNDNFNWRSVLDDWENVINQLNSGSMPYENDVFNQTWVNRADSLIRLADENDMQITGEAFFWLHDIPSYLYSNEYTANEKSRILEFMVKAKMIKFGEVDNWIAFSEMGAAELWAPENFKTLYNQLGKRELLVDIIKWAREINPQIKLIAVEDHLLDANYDATRQSTNGFNQILNYLEQKGVRPEFVESEDNLWTYAPPNPTDAQQIIQMYQNKGYEIYPAEMTISTLSQYPLWSDRPKTLTNPLTQLEIFKFMAEIYINSGTGLGLFSGTDNITWIHEIGATQEKPELFADQNYQPKPGMYLFRAILLELLKK